MYKFNVERVTNELVNWIKMWFEENGPKSKAVLGISGGKDSTVAAALCVKALGPDRVLGLMLPNGEQSDIADAKEVCDILGIPNLTINIKSGVDATYNVLNDCELYITKQARENLPPRERTKVIRAVCQCVNGRMVNTCNLSEDYIGYFTIGGDGDGDFAPLGGLTKTEVVAIGKYLKLPNHLVDKTPADGLCGKTDEDNFGFTYEALDQYIRIGTSGNKETDDLIRKKHETNLFKLKPMDKFIV